MLWRKELNRSNAPYVDICTTSTMAKGLFGNPSLTKHIVSTLNKNDSVALEKRLKGNESFSNDEFKEAMELYNESLCFAEPKPCTCERCYGPAASKAQRKQIASDPDYIFLSKLLSIVNPQTAIDKCVSLLTKYGRMNWCDEIGKMVLIYTTARFSEFSGKKSTTDSP